MNTVLCNCEAIINSRPLTYLTEESTEIAAITPAMFISDIRKNGIPDLDQVNRIFFAKRLRYRQRLKEELRQRFRLQYLGQLSRRTKHKNSSISVTIGDIVLVGNDLQKRLDWPLAKVIQVFPGKDGHTRVAKLKTARGELIRPIQRLFPLEVRYSGREADKFFETIKTVSEAVKESESDPKEDTRPLTKPGLTTRSGRVVKKPERLGF
ncbi:PREDICTED: uncharacterized protein LOC105448087 [Wasmannia auropunctata]|uniref:uncharacterized protein LOC105448087 n=1 Tax=Wasmannia auropunctata TaxID=64793 RepID=UPI0005EE32A4|nr:PREDICTED: uncharacterized protein LOC105448087 [Wasmannia auropunctata]